MAIDPDMQPILDAITARLDVIEAGGTNDLLTAERAFSASFATMLNGKSVADQIAALNSLTGAIAAL